LGPRKLIRLKKDHEELMRLASARAGLLEFTTKGTPPTQYFFTIRLKGLQLAPDGRHAIVREEHRFEMRLGAHYPSDAPDVTWRTPIFHPNIRGEAVCHSQQWSPAWSLADFVIEIGDMIRMDKFNTQSPLDRKAAVWADKNAERFPIDERNLRPAEHRIQVRLKPKDPA
jgi:ubiquitin-protein ligase